MSRSLSFGLVGHNISYTLSPVIFRALFEIAGSEGTFEVIDLEPSKLAAGLDMMRRWDGFSVTVPYKQKVICEMDFISDTAREIGAVNSVKVEEGRFLGHNTDADGFMAPLSKFSFDGMRVLVLGHGGAARAVIWAMTREYPAAEIFICGRQKEKVRAFIDGFHLAWGGLEKIHALTYEGIGKDDGYNLIINCTPVGGMGYPDLSPLPETFNFNECRVCYDLNYRPSKTVFLRRAEAAGCRIFGGLPMLVRQAVLSYNIWTGSESEIELVSEEVMERLREGNQGVDL